MSDRKPSPNDLEYAPTREEVLAARATDLDREEAEAENRPPVMFVTVDQDRSAIAYLRGHILDMLFERQDGECSLCGQAMPEDDRSMHIHHEPPLSVRMPDGRGPATMMDQLHLTHPGCNLGHKKPRRKPRG